MISKQEFIYGCAKPRYLQASTSFSAPKWYYGSDYLTRSTDSLNIQRIFKTEN